MILLLAATATALATGLGAIPVFALGSRAAALQPLLLGLAAGAMSVASVAGLLLPGLDEGSTLTVGAGLAFGAAFLVLARSALAARQHHVQRAWSAGLRASVLVFVVLLVHSLPEGLAIGTAYASETAGLSLFVITAIAVQNIPEGTSVAIPMAAAGFSRSRSFGPPSRPARLNRWERRSPSSSSSRSSRCCLSRSGSPPAPCSPW